VIATYVGCNAISHDKYFELITLVLSGISMYVMYYYYYHHKHFILTVITVIILVVAATFLALFLKSKYKILSSVMFRSYVLPLHPDKTRKKGHPYSTMAV
jgi:uncharacterized membrane-anchored protein